MSIKMMRIDDNMLEAVSGGSLCKIWDDIKQMLYHWEVIDASGETVWSCKYFRHAEFYAKKHNYGIDKISMEELETRRAGVRNL